MSVETNQVIWSLALFLFKQHLSFCSLSKWFHAAKVGCSMTNWPWPKTFYVRHFTSCQVIGVGYPRPAPRPARRARRPGPRFVHAHVHAESGHMFIFVHCRGVALYRSRYKMSESVSQALTKKKSKKRRKGKNGKVESTVSDTTSDQHESKMPKVRPLWSTLASSWFHNNYTCF